MAVTTTSTYSNLSSYVSRKGLAVAKPNLIYNAYGEQYSIPQKNSSTIKWRRFERFSPTTGAQLAASRILVEGTTPSDTAGTVTDVTLSLSQYGFLTKWSEVAAWTNEVSVDQNLMERNSQNMSETVDCVTRDSIQAGTNVFRLTDDVGGVSGAARTDVDGKINATALDLAIRNLENSDAKYFSEMISASNKVGTSGVRPAYIMHIHPYVKYDLESVPGFKAVPDYGSYEGVMVGEVGSYKNIRFVQSTLAKYFADAGGAVSGLGLKSTTGTLADVYSCTLVGKNAYGVVNLASAAEIKYTPHTSVDHSNPLGQWASLGWKAMCGAKILNDNWILRFECAASA